MLKLGYTVIQHAPRIKYQLSMTEYSIAAAIYHLSNNPKAPVRGWCNASKKKLAGFFGIADRTLFNALDALEAGGWLERHTVPGFNGLVRTTARWYDEIESWTGEQDTGGLLVPQARGMQKMHTHPPEDDTLGGVQNVHTPPMQNVQRGYAKSADYSNSSNNSTDTTVSVKPEKKNKAATAPKIQTPPDTAPRCEAPPQDAEEVVELYNEMAEYWNVSAKRYIGQYSLIRAFVRLHAKGAVVGGEAGSLEFIRDQFHAYKATRVGIGPHTLDNWLGHDGNEWNGAWREKDWVAYLAQREASAATKQPNPFARPGRGSHLSTRAAAAQAAIADLTDNDTTESYSFNSPASNE